MISELKKNIDTEIEMVREISEYVKELAHANNDEAVLLRKTIKSLKKSIKLINLSVPSLLKETLLGKKLPSVEKVKGRASKLERVEFRRVGPTVSVVLSKEDRGLFFKELSISEELIKKLRKNRQRKQEFYEEFQASRGYVKLANRFFLNKSSSMVKNGQFKDLSLEIKKANLNMLLESYVAVMLFSVLLVFVLSFLLMFGLLFFNIGFSFPFIEFYTGGYILRIGKIFWIPLVLPLIAYLGFYVYPSTEKKSLEHRINQELPFAVIHMSAISGSGIAPTEIFKIIGLNKEYPYLRKEIRKILNQINLYGYDLVTALNNSSKSAPSEKLSELLSGLSTTITSGADLSEFLEKRSESLLIGYRLEREKYTKLVETFLDIYISIVVAAPMVFLLLLVMMIISGVNVGLSSIELSAVVVAGISLLNILFLVFLQLKQPSY